MRVYTREEERQFRELIKDIRSSGLETDTIDFFVKYVSDVKDGKITNDFYDFEFLSSVIVELCSNEYDSHEELVKTFNELIARTKLLLPQGDKTNGYEAIKREIVNYYCDIERNNIFSAALYSMFSNRLDYLQIMGIILNDDNLIQNFDTIENFAIRLGKEISDEGLLKREIISYLHLYGSILSSDEDYLQNRIDEARMRYGVYPGINEKTVAVISGHVKKMNGLIKKHEVLEKKVDSYMDRVDAKTRAGIDSIIEATNDGKRDIQEFSTNAITQMQNDLAEAKKDLLNELNSYLEQLENTMKSNFDQVSNQLMIDARETLNQIKAASVSIAGVTTKEVLRAQSALDSLKKYVETSPDLQQSLKVVADSETVMNALLKYNAVQGAVAAKVEQGIEGTPTEIVIPQKEIIMATGQEDFLVPTFKMTEGILPAFDRSIDFDVRMNRIEQRIKDLESQGLIIPEVLREALPWYIMGKKVVFFHGPTQSGKTTIADLLAKVVETELIDGGKITEEVSVTSYNDVRGVFDENALFYSLYYGLSILYDEIDNGNPDNIIVLGTYMSKLATKIDHPEKEVYAQFAKRRFVPINPNARIILCGNTPGKGRNKQYSARNKFDESTLERVVHFYTGYDTRLESHIFGPYTEMLEFFNEFRSACDSWTNVSDKDAAEGNVTTGDASTIVECIKEKSVNISSLIKALFVQTKESNYLGHIIAKLEEKYGKEEATDENMENYNKTHLEELAAKDIAKVFKYEAKAAMEKNKVLERKK